MHLIFNALLYGLVSMFIKKQKPVRRTERETSMECLAFDSMEARHQRMPYKEPTGDVHRDIVDDGTGW